MDSRPFWETVPPAEMTADQWESLCDGCGQCCLVKLEAADGVGVELTRVACRLFDPATCRCTDYAARARRVPECVVLTPARLALPWMPPTCAYRLVHERRPLPAWHPLVSGDPESVHRAGASVRGRVVSECDIDDADLESFVVDRL